MSMSKRAPFIIGASVAISAFVAAVSGSAQQFDGRYGFGDKAPEELIKAWAIAIPPDGQHLPAGGATAKEGAKVFAEKCVACHGKDLQGVDGTGGVALIGGRGSLASGSPKKTVESYWPYATTVFDYVRRAMPFNEPGSLTDEEVYAVTAYILNRGNIIAEDKRMDKDSLPKVEMPNRGGFYRSDLPDVVSYR